MVNSSGMMKLRRSYQNLQINCKQIFFLSMYFIFNHMWIKAIYVFPGCQINILKTFLKCSSTQVFLFFYNCDFQSHSSIFMNRLDERFTWVRNKMLFIALQNAEAFSVFQGCQLKHCKKSSTGHKKFKVVSELWLQCHESNFMN